ncbi:hypothetical protein EIN_323220 [Entamoeba invadens IP1]|uniref:Uncharacterized protein n=1 Tax=Entamoeba invadens IP1 TaxID=370355 RepID=L7FNL2_ENTIV|nr:hypothetical protein EIN_323220 [Entamoeba invadens IP1]ELP88595.1 hypothetical protein EIN_323220 [Entamoeba invadens IP1]|eukprot:XP_004255366.1 hypothetical protein EIN_323220 [Entamoeba invadens IP1]
MDTHFNLCATDFSRKCVECITGYYPDLLGTCVLCDPSCINKCNKRMGYCESCIANYVLISSENPKCQKCDEFDTNCKTCSPDNNRKCVECNTNYYPNTSNDTDVNFAILLVGVHAVVQQVRVPVVHQITSFQ